MSEYRDRSPSSQCSTKDLSVRTCYTQLIQVLKWHDVPAAPIFLSMVDVFRRGWQRACRPWARSSRRRSRTTTVATNSSGGCPIRSGSSHLVRSWEWIGIRPASRPASSERSSAGLGPLSGELGIHVCGGRGKHSRKILDELRLLGERVGFDGANLTRASRLVAKVDGAAVQDGFELYLHGFFVTDDESGRWCSRV
jgi:hypothetical protein